MLFRSRLNPTTESNVVTYEVVVAAANPDHKLIPGLTANLTIYVMREQDVLTLPVNVFTFEPREQDKDGKLPAVAADTDLKSLAKDQKRVWVLDNNTLVPRVVTVGLSNGMKTVITGGLTEGTEVATGYRESSQMKQEEAERSPFAPQPPGRKK